MREIFNDAEFQLPNPPPPSPPFRTATCTLTPLSEPFSFQCLTYRPTEYCPQGVGFGGAQVSVSVHFLPSQYKTH